jgi:hypothetical protein
VKARPRGFSEPVVIPATPVDLWPSVNMGREVEFAPVGMTESQAAGRVVEILETVKGLIPNAPRDPQFPQDVFTPLGRIYAELTVLLEIAGPTCISPEAVACTYEAAFSLLRTAGSLQGPDGPAVFTHTPSDYGDVLGSSASAHSTGCHLSFHSHQPLDEGKLRQFASIVSTLNIVFGPGGLTCPLGDRIRICCDPRADHVSQLFAQSAHGLSPKPFFLIRDEPWAEAPAWRLQIAAFGAPRSPVCSWLQAGLLQLAFRQVLMEDATPWPIDNPIAALRAAPDELLYPSLFWGSWGRKPHTKLEVAIKTVKWLSKHGMQQAPDEATAARIESMCLLAIDVARANVISSDDLPTAPSDIAIKTYLLNRVARMHGFADVSELGRQYSRYPETGGSVGRALETMITVDALFHSTCDQYSTYEMAAREGVFVKPEFEHPVELADLPQLPGGVARRDRTRAALLSAGRDGQRISTCNWTGLTMQNGRVIHLPNPWSGMAVSEMPVGFMGTTL